MQMPRGWMLLAVTLVLAGYGLAGNRNRPLKVASLNIDRAVFDTEEGKRSAKELSVTFERDQAELKTMSTEIESRKKRLKDHAQEMSDADRRTIQTEIDFLQTNLDSSTHRVKEDQSARLTLRDSIIKKMAPIVVRPAQQKRMNAILDASPGDRALKFSTAFDSVRISSFYRKLRVTLARVESLSTFRAFDQTNSPA